MRYWIRELAGWLIVGIGLLLIYAAYTMCDAYRPRILEAWPMVIAGIFVFRGGIHLLKVAVAARVCLQAQDRLYPTVAAGADSKRSRPSVEVKTTRPGAGPRT
jgi:hypothetical protein